MGVKTARGIYLNEFLSKGDNSRDNIPERGINLIKKVISPHKIIVLQIIFYYPFYWSKYQK